MILSVFSCVCNRSVSNSKLSADFIRQLDAKDAILARQNRRAGLPERQAVLPALPSIGV